MKNNLTEHVKSIGKEFDEKLSELDGVSTNLDVNYLRDRILKWRKEIKSSVFLSQSKTLELLKEELEGMKKFKGAKFYGIDEKYWIKAEMIPSNARKEIFNSALSQALPLLDTIIQNLKSQIK